MSKHLCFVCMSSIDSPEAVCSHCGHDNHIRDNGPGLLSGGMLAGKYLVGKLLGRGGFGATYMGYDTFLQRRVAIKEYFPTNLVMRDGNSSNLSVISGGAESFAKGRERALRESRMASGLGSIPGIVQTYDVFSANNTIYIVMEYVEGDTLTKYVQKQPEKLSLFRAIELLEPVASALSVLHESKVVHRDVKPDNIIIRKRPEQGVLLDFGAAKVDDGSTMSNSSAVVSPGFAPPEQYNSTSLDGRIDQYAFAATLYYMLTGERPPDVMMRMVDETATKPLRDFNPGISEEAEAVILKGMSIRANERYEDMEAFWSALKETLQPRPAPPVPPKPPVPPAPPERRKTKYLIPVIIAIFAALVIMLMASKDEKKPETVPVALAAGFEHIVGIKPDGTVVAVGQNSHGQCNVKGWKDIVQVSAGDYHTVGLKSDGTVVATGYTGNGQCDVEEWTDIVQISAGIYHTIGLKSDGTVVAVGMNDDKQCNVSDWTDIVYVSAGYFYTVGVKSDGTVVATGDNEFSQCEVNDWTDIVQVATGLSHTVGLKSDGTVVTAGSNFYNQDESSAWTDVTQISAGFSHSACLKSDGTILITKNSSVSWTNIIQIAAGKNYTVGLRNDGTVISVGLDDERRSAIESWKLMTTNSSTPRNFDSSIEHNLKIAQ